MGGKSRDQSWSVTNDSRQVRISVGADPECRWHVTGQGVAPLHFELYWDGAALWAADTQSAGSVTIDGVPLGDWTQITGRVRIAFGRAAMIVETSLAADVSVLASGAAADGTALDLPREGAVVQRGPISERDTRATLPDPGSAPSLADGATHLISSPPDLEGLSPDDTAPFERWPGEQAHAKPAPAERGGGAAARPPGMAAAPARAADPDTRLAVPAARGATPKGTAQPRARQAAPAPAAEDPAATRLVSSPAGGGAPVTGRPPPFAAPGAAPAPAAPAGVVARPRLGGEPPPAFHDRPTVIVPSAAEAAGLPEIATEPSEPLMHIRETAAPAHAARAVRATPQPGAQGAQPPTPLTLPAPSTPASASLGPVANEVTPFAPPPTGGTVRASRVVKAEGPKKKMAMPLRTWLLFALVVVAAAGAVLLDEDEPPPHAPRTATAAQQGGASGTPGAGVAATAGGTGAGRVTTPAGVPDQGMPRTVPTQALQVAQIATPQPTTEPGTETDATAPAEPGAEPVVPAPVPMPAPVPVPAGATTPESAAADLLITGHHREALERYERLAAERPETATFGTIAKILRRRLAAQCRDGFGPGGEPCATP